MSEKYLSKACQAKVTAMADNLGDSLGLNDKEMTHLLKQTIDKVGKEKKIYEMVNSFIVNSYLSGTGTPVANALSVFLQSVIKPMTYSIGAITDALGATKGDRHLSDVLHMIEASLEGFASDMRYFHAGRVSGKPLDIGESIEALASASNKDYKTMRTAVINALVDRHIEFQRTKGVTTDDDMLRDAFIQSMRTKEGGIDGVIKEYLGENYDYITGVWPEPIGKVINVPTRISVAIDEYGKARLRRMKIAELASRKARADAKAGKGTYHDLYRTYQKMSLEGTNDSAIGYRDIQKTFATLQKNLSNLHGDYEGDLKPYNDVKEFALDNTFQSKLHGNLQKIASMRHADSWTSTLATMFVPFIKTPWNILKEGGTYIPVMGFATRPKYVKGLEVVPMSMDELIPRQILGASMFAGITAMYGNGYITGTPKDAKEAQQWKDAGIQQQSMLIGDQWVSYARLEPIATVFGLASDLNEMVRSYQADPSPDKDIVEYGIFETLNALKSNILSKSFVEGFATLAEGIAQPDKQWQAFVNTAARPLTPALLNEVARIKDDYERQASTVGEKIQQRIPFFRESLPKDYGAYGGARKTDHTQAVTGFYTLDDAQRTEVQKEVAATGTRITRPTNNLKKVKLDNQKLGLYRAKSDEYTSLYLDRTIQQPYYKNADMGAKRRALEVAAAAGRKRAREELFAKWVKEDAPFARKWYMEEMQSKGMLAEAPLM